MGRCLSPCLRDLDPNAYRRRLDEALAPFTGRGDGGEALLARIEEQMNEAAAAQRYERAAVLLRRRDRLAALVTRLSGVLEAAHARSRLVLAKHPAKDRWDAFWVIAGSVVDWGPLPEPGEVAARTGRALERRPRRPRPVAPEQVDEIRMMPPWIAPYAPPLLELDPAPAREDLERWMRRAAGLP